MYKIIYVCFESSDDTIVPEMLEGSFSSVEEAQEYLEKELINDIRDKQIPAIGKEFADKLKITYEKNGNRATIDVIEVEYHLGLVERYEFNIVDIDN